ncbi:MAG: hypothetical protein ACI9IV_000960 [Paracoccaceae bacterium]|jgi:hypothetical protein
MVTTDTNEPHRDAVHIAVIGGISTLKTLVQKHRQSDRMSGPQEDLGKRTNTCATTSGCCTSRGTC